MKVNQTISLDYDLVQKLRGEANASGLINQLLTSHYGDPRSEEQIIDDVKAKIAEKEAKIKHEKKFQKKLEKRMAEMKKNKHKTKFGGTTHD